MYNEIFYILSEFLYGTVVSSGAEYLTCTFISSVFAIVLVALPIIICFFLLRWLSSLLFSGR